MKNQKNEGLWAMVTRVRSSKGWRILFAFELVVAFAALSAAGPAQVALADSGGVKGHTFDATFTKWVTSTTPAGVPVDMVGVVGGDVGKGSFAGTVLSYTPVGLTTNIEALYQFNGSKHSFAADVHVTETDTNLPGANAFGTAVITGVVTQGWLKGAHLTGEYTAFAVCPIATLGNVFGTVCFQGTLHVHRGSEQ